MVKGILSNINEFLVNGHLHSNVYMSRYIYSLYSRDIFYCI